MIFVMKYLALFYSPSIWSKYRILKIIQNKKCVFKNVDNKEGSLKTSPIVEDVKIIRGDSSDF